MGQKIIKIGSSAGITISKEALADLGVGVGDVIEAHSSPGVFTVKPAAQSAIDPQILQWGQEFINKNRELLKRLKDK